MEIIQRIKRWFGWGEAEVRVIVAGDLADLARMAGGMEEAYLLKRVMDWCASNDKRDSKRHFKSGKYWMYYSYKEWTAKEMQWRTEAQVKLSIKKLEDAGLLISRVFRDGGSKYYRPNLEMIRGMESDVPANVVQFKPQTPCENPQTPLLKTANINLLNQPSNPTFLNQGSEKPYSGGVGGDDSDKEHPLKENDLKALIKEYGRVEVDDAVGRAMEQQARKSNVRNIGAYVRVILRNERMNGKVDANPLVRSMNVNPPEREEIPSPQPPPRFAKRGSEKPADVSVEAAAWMAAYGQLELILDSENFNTWLRDCEFVGADDGVYVVQAKNSYARDMLQHRLYRNVRRVLSDVLGAEVELKFVVSGEAVAS